MAFIIVPTPPILKNDVECICVTTQDEGGGQATINVCLNGLPGIIFQHYNGQSPIEAITTRLRTTVEMPTLYVYGQMTEPSVMSYRYEPASTVQVILKPHALQTLLGLNASSVTNSTMELSEFSPKYLNDQLIETRSKQEQVNHIINFLVAKLNQNRKRDPLIEESLYLIHRDIGTISVSQLLDRLSLSERQFEKRFTQTVGLTPNFYIRVKRFNEALRLMRVRPADKLTDVAYSLNYYDQSHFIRDVKAFSGITPKSLLQRVDFNPTDGVYAYL